MNFLKLFTNIGLIAAHRGANSIAPENTMSALKASVGECDFIEIDVRLSSDSVAIIIHDDTLDRTTNIKEIAAFKSREPFRVSDFTFNELSTLDYGSWFNGEFEPLLTLRNALAFIKENRLYINIQIKDMHNTFSDEKVVSTILKEIADKEIHNHVLLSSFRHEYLSMIKERLPDIATAALVEHEHPNRLIEYLKSLHVDAYHLNDELVDKQTVAKLTNAGFFVNVYTVNDQVRAQELFGIGVSAVFSDSLHKRG